MRAARIGCHVWCVDTKMFVKQPDLEQSPIAKLELDERRRRDAAVVHAAAVVGGGRQEGDGQGLEPGDQGADHRRLLGRRARRSARRTRSRRPADLGKEETFTVDHPIWSKEEANALAKARLQRSRR